MHVTHTWVFAVVLAGLTACDAGTTAPPVQEAPDVVANLTVETAPNVLDAINERLAAQGADYMVAVAEYVTDVESGEPGQIVFAKNVGHKMLGHHFVNGDPRRSGRSNITYIIDSTEDATSQGANPLTGAETTPALHASMATWDAVGCADPAVTNLGELPLDLGVVQFQLGFGGVGGFAADITHAGWLPWEFFESLRPGGGDGILGVTFTFTWRSGGNQTDIDGDGRADVAFREIYYNDAFEWGVDGSATLFDVETVAVHEVGHGLSQGHFGQLSFNLSANKYTLAPDAVMNAAIGAGWIKRDLQGSDQGGHCTSWGSW